MANLVKALTLQVYAHPQYRGCANGGWTEEHNELFVACDDGNCYAPEDSPALFDLAAGPFGTIHLRPRNGGDGAGPMMGGSYAGTCDSRFSEMCAELAGMRYWHGAVAVHDRYESRELYERLSN